MFIATFAAKSNRVQSCDVVKVIMEMKDGGELLLTLLTTAIICEPIVCRSLNESVRFYEHLHGIELAEPAGEGELIEFDILIGLDFYWDIITGEVIRGISGPTAVYSRLGWILSGPTVTDSSSLMTHVLTTGVRAIEDKSRLGEQLASFWKLESLGILEHELTLYDQFKDHIKFDGTRYEVPLPWRDNIATLPDNYDLSLSRLKGLLRRLKHNPQLLQEYNKSILHEIKSGIVEVVEDPALIEGDKVHYLPHHAVIRQDKQTTKLRIVYDASAKSNGLSLNECLHIGPKFNQRIFEILLRFRLHNNGFIADVEKAFLMISICKHDRDVLRFLWVKDPHQEPLDIQVLRFKRVTFGVTASPFLLNATMRYHIESFKPFKPVLVNKLLHSVYVDDVVCGSESMEESLQTFEQFRDMLAIGGFNLRKYVCSGTVPPDAGGEQQKVLGVTWSVAIDELMIDLKFITREANTLNPTKRHIVSIASKIYDPIGLVSPITIWFKVLLQELHGARIEWDEEINGELLDRWNALISCISGSEPVTIPRHYFQLKLSKCQWRLIGFSDSSVKAYAAVVYLRCESSEARQMSLVASKTRLAPFFLCLFLSCLFVSHSLQYQFMSVVYAVQLLSEYHEQG